MKGLRLSALRVNAQLTQKEVGLHIGVTKETIGRWERYETIPQATQLICLANLYNCELDDIFLPDKLAKS